MKEIVIVITALGCRRKPPSYRNLHEAGNHHHVFDEN